MKHSKKIILWLIVSMLIVPVLLSQINSSERRSFQGIRLNETTYQEITFQNNIQNIELGGMLFIPEGTGPFPSAVIIHGSGSSQRDNAWYLTLAQNLQYNGIAVLLPDKRGSVKSSGDWRISSFEDLSTDTIAAIDFLNTQQALPISYIGIIGMSQGGWVAPIVANKSAHINYLVNIVGSAVTTHEQLQFEENNNLKEIGFLTGVSNVIALLSTSVLKNLTQKDFWTAIGDFNPLPHWKDLPIRSLTLYGENDTNVPSRESAIRLRSLRNPNIEIKIYQGSGHALEEPLSQGDSIFRNDALDDITNFILSNPVD